MDAIPISIRAVLFLLVGLAIFGVFIRMIWTGRSYENLFSPADPAAVRPLSYRIFMTIVFISFATFFGLTTWAEGFAPATPDPAAGAVIEWVYRGEAHYLTATYNSYLQASKAIGAVMFVVFAVYSLWQGVRVKLQQSRK